MVSRAKSVRVGQGRGADVAALRSKAAELYADGKDARQVADALGVTLRAARRYKSETGATVKAAAAATIDGIVEGGNRARAVFVEHAETLAQMLVDAARGQLKHGDETRDADPIERDPQMINARTKAASIALQFILAQKVEQTLKADLTPETAAAVVAIAVSERR